MQDIKVENQITGRLYQDILEIEEYDIDWDQFSGKSILITGANGFIAFHMAAAMLLWNDMHPDREPVLVYGLVRNKAKAEAKYGKLCDREDLILFEEDVCSFSTDSLKKSGEERDNHLDYIIHAASQASAKQFNEDPVGTINANLWLLIARI